MRNTELRHHIDDADEVENRQARNPGVTDGSDRPAVAAAGIAAVLGLASAAVSAYWALGGTGLLDTIGGDIERWGRERGATVVAALWFIVVLKAVVAVAPVIIVRSGVAGLPAWTAGRLPRLLGWIAAITLTIYGGALTIAGLLVETGILDAAGDVDKTALAWHTYFWDPWFAIWGVAFVVALWRSRGGRRVDVEPVLGGDELSAAT